MPTQNNRRPATGAAAGRRPSEPRANLDPGAYIGRKPERTAETIPGGVGPQDRRSSAVATQPTGAPRRDAARDAGAPPDGRTEDGDARTGSAGEATPATADAGSRG